MKNLLFFLIIQYPESIISKKNPQWGKFNKKGRTSKRETDLYTLNLQED